MVEHDLGIHWAIAILSTFFCIELQYTTLQDGIANPFRSICQSHT